MDNVPRILFSLGEELKDKSNLLGSGIDLFGSSMSSAKHPLKAVRITTQKNKLLSFI